MDTRRRQYACAAASASLALLCAPLCAQDRASELAPAELLRAFQDPPARARPDAFWTWLNGHTDRERITEELEAFDAAGFARLQVWDVAAYRDPEGIVPVGPAFLSEDWLAALVHADAEAERLGLELGLVAASGWNAGGSHVAPERAGLSLYASQTTLRGPARVEVALARPAVPDHVPRTAAGQPACWATIAVHAEPDAAGAPFDPARVIDLTEAIDAEGRLTWDVPDGAWTVRWFVRAASGQRLIVPSPGSDGLQIDFFDSADTEAHFEHVLTRLEGALGPLAETSLRYLEVDSLELDGARLHAWTEDVLASFSERFAYDAAPWLTLLVEADRADDRGARFLHDWSRHISDRMIEHHYRFGAQQLAARGLLLAAEAGGPGPPIWNSCPVDALGALGAVGLMRGEFWPKHRSMFNVKQIASAAHIYGHTIVDAEAFTSWRHWRDLPYYLKLVVDQAFVDGLNHVTFHTAPHRGAGSGAPGFAYHAGTHIGPGLVWWPMARPFIDYISRCSLLLQEGRPVADVLFYQGDGAPNFHPLAVDWEPGLRERGYDYDLVDVRTLVGALRAVDGRAALPHGVSYTLLALPEHDGIAPEALASVAQLVRGGVPVVGPRPQRASGLAGYPEVDDRIRAQARELWGPEDRATEADVAVDGNRVRDITVQRALQELGVLPDFEWRGAPDGRTRLAWTHRRSAHADIYFVVNSNERFEAVEATFRVHGREPELWDPLTGRTRRAPHRATADGRTEVPLDLAPGGSLFVVFPDNATAPLVAAAPAAGSPTQPSVSVDLAHGEPNAGPAWLSAGLVSPDEEWIVYDLGATVDLGELRVWNYQDPVRGLLTRGIRTFELQVSTDGVEFQSLGLRELQAAPEIGERGYEQSVAATAPACRFVRFAVVANHSDDWSGRTRTVGLGRVRFLGADGAPIRGVALHAVSSGTAFDPDEGDPISASVGVRTLSGPYRVRFQAGLGAPDEVIWSELPSWTASDDPGIRNFSGVAEYHTTFTVDPSELERSGALWLDLGRVAGVARVGLNGVDLGVLWCPPYALDVSGVLRAGENELTCEVANTWHNRLVGDAGLAAEARVTRTNLAHLFRAGMPLLESGLRGPLRLTAGPPRAVR